jgi:HAMP domain-containing protein
MGLFETPIALGALFVALTAFVIWRWKGRPRDEWRREPKPKAPNEPGS